MVFIVNIVCLAILIKTVSSQNFVFISDKETSTFQFNPSSPNDISNIKVTYHGSESWCKINDMYEFISPVVKPECTCSCVNSAKNDCKFSTQNSFCIRNKTVSCSPYVTTFEHRAVCSDLVQICCQVYFIAKNDTEKFQAITFIPKKTVFYFTFIIENALGFSKILKLAVPSDMKYIRLDGNIVMEIQMDFIEMPLPKRWYFTKNGVNILTSTYELNGKFTYELNKLAWFKRNSTGLVTAVSSYDLSNYLHVTPLSCSNNYMQFKWNFEARHYCRENQVCTDPKDQLVLQAMYDSVSNATVNISSREVKIKQKNPQKAKILIKQYPDRNEKSVILYEAYIFRVNNSGQNLTLKLLYSDKSELRIVTGIQDWTWSHTFIITVNVPGTFPCFYSFTLSHFMVDSVWVCVYANDDLKKHLCQFIQFMNESSINRVALNNNYNFSVSSKIIEVSSNQLETSSWHIAIACITFLLIISITVIVVGIYKYRKLKMKKILCEEVPLISNEYITVYPSKDIGLMNMLEEKMKYIYKYKNIYNDFFTSKISFDFSKDYLQPNLKMNTPSDVTKISISEMFNKCNAYKRILIEGEPGFGKTTFTLKLAYEWTIGSFPKFKLAIAIPLKNVRKSLNEFIAELLTINDVSTNNIISCIEHFQSEILMILDGYNDLHENRKQELLPLLKGLVYPNMTIVITSRTGYYTSESISSKIKFIKDHEPVNPSCCRLKLKGIDKNARKQYLEESLRSSSNKDISQYASLLEFSLLKYPKILIMVGKIISKLQENVCQITIIYQNLLHFLIQRYIENIDKENQANKNRHENSVKETLRNMGEYAFSSKVLESETNSNSNSNNICEIMCDSGILIKKENKVYEPFHPSLFDYLAAFYLNDLYVSSKESFQIKIVEIMPVVFQIPPDSMLFLFLVGLFNKNVPVLLDIFKNYEFMIRAYFQMLVEILSDIQTDEFDLTSLRPFIPKVWKIPWPDIEWNFAKTTLHSKMIRYGIQEKLIMIIDLEVKYKCNYPENIKVDKLIIRLKDHVNNFYKEIGEKMHCKELLCLIYSNSEDDLKKIWNDFFTLIGKITYEIISFQVWSPLCISQLNLKSMVCETPFKNKLYCFQCQIYSEKGYFKKHSDGNYNNNDIIRIIESNKLKIIHLAFHGDVKVYSFQAFIDAILKSVSVSRNIEQLVLLNKTKCDCDIDLKLLTNNGDRSFSVVWFLGFSLKCDEQDDWALNVKNFTHWNFVKESAVLFEKRIVGAEIVAIEGELLCEEAVNNAEHFNKFLNNLKELDTTLGRLVYDEDILKHVQKCSNLQILYLTTTSLSNRFFPRAVTHFINTLSVMKSVHTLMFWHGEENFPFHISLFKELKKQNSSNKLRKLKNLKFTCSIHNQNDESFNHLSNIMEIFGDLVIQEWIEGYISVVTQIGSDMLQETNKFFDIIKETLLPRDELIITSDFDGSSDEECCYSQRFFLVGKLQESFIIKKRQKQCINKPK